MSIETPAVQETLFDDIPDIQDFSANHPGFIVYTEGNDDYLTPPGILKRLGQFDLDVCAPANRPWDTAHGHFTREMDGLSLPWHGRVWMNPPYGKSTGLWLKRLADHGNGIAMIFARTETKAFFATVWDRANAVLFLKGRVNFHRLNGDRYPTNCGAPSCLVAYGKANVKVLEVSGIAGYLVRLNRPRRRFKISTRMKRFFNFKR